MKMFAPALRAFFIVNKMKKAELQGSRLLRIIELNLGNYKHQMGDLPLRRSFASLYCSFQMHVLQHIAPLSTSTILLPLHLQMHICVELT
jgi:hypothetical protein